MFLEKIWKLRRILSVSLKNVTEGFLSVIVVYKYYLIKKFNERV